MTLIDKLKDILSDLRPADSHKCRDLRTYLDGIELLIKFGPDSLSAEELGYIIACSKAVRQNPASTANLKQRTSKLRKLKNLEEDLEHMAATSKRSDKTERSAKKNIPDFPGEKDPAPVKNLSVLKDSKNKLRHDLMDPVIKWEILHWLTVLSASGFAIVENVPEEDVVEECTRLMSTGNWVMACVYVMLVRAVTMDDIIRCYALGAAKYSDYGWKNNTPDQYFAAAYRHLKDGMNHDDGPLSHWTHFCWNMTALRYFEKRGKIPYGLI